MGTLTQGCKDAGGLPRGADGLDVQSQDQVLAWDRQEALGLQVGAEHPMPLLVSHFFIDSSWTWKRSYCREAGRKWEGSKPRLADQGSSDSTNLFSSQRKCKVLSNTIPSCHRPQSLLDEATVRPLWFKTWALDLSSNISSS